MQLQTVVLFLAEISVSSPPKNTHLKYLKKYLLDQSIQNIFYFILKKETLVVAHTPSSMRTACAKSRGPQSTKRHSDQCLCLSRNIAYVTPKIIYFHYFY